MCWLVRCINMMFLFSPPASQNVLKSKEPSFLTTLLPSNSHGPSSGPSVNVSAHLTPTQSQHFEQVDKTSPYMLIYRGQNGSTDSKHMRLEVGLHTTKQICDASLQYIKQCGWKKGKWNWNGIQRCWGSSLWMQKVFQSCFHTGLTALRIVVNLPYTSSRLGNEEKLRCLCGWKDRTEQKKKKEEKDVSDCFQNHFCFLLLVGWSGSTV